MEDTKSLLVMVLQKVFHNRPKIVEDTYQLIYNYNNGKREKNEYEKTLKTICDLMNDELPSQILVYLLTLVDMPKEDGCQLPIMEKMQKTHNCLPESVRPHLLEYLRSKTTSSKPIVSSTSCSDSSKGDTSKQEKMNNLTNDGESLFSSETFDDTVFQNQDDNFIRPVKRPRNKRKISKQCEQGENSEEVKSLLDTVANYIIRNERSLNLHYKRKLKKCWSLINSNMYEGDNLRQCYNVVKDLNKKTKLLRMIENDNITADIFFDEYQDSEIFLKEKHMFHVLNSDPFIISDELMNSIKLFFKKN